ncbi:MAG: cobalt ECF transporter T component CbiQ [Deltaproteobacteria bacterium]|nr:cobalt ECF transporter T component CbiQ [Deltaproteobacteria bacterium]
MKQRQAPVSGPAPRRGFIEKNLSSFTAFLNGALPERRSRLPGLLQPGLLQKVEPGARIYGVLALVLTGAAASRASVSAVLCVITVALAVLSRVGLWELAKRVLPAFIFTTALVAPVSFSFITPGEELWGAGGGGFRLSVTREGAQAALFFILRVVSMVSPVSLLMMTTAQAEFFRGLGKLPVPAFFKTAVFMTFRYVFILLKAAEDASLARRSRTITRPRLAESQRWFASRAAFLLKKSLTTAEEVTMAMSSRGFSGRIRTFESARMRGRDLLWLGFASFVFFMSLGI